MTFLITPECKVPGARGVAIHKQPRPPYCCSAGVLLCLLVFGSSHQLLLLLIVGLFVRDLIALSPEPRAFIGECFSLAQLVTRLHFGSDHDVLPGFGANPAQLSENKTV